jgi:hypothetical protein
MTGMRVLIVAVVLLAVACTAQPPSGPGIIAYPAPKGETPSADYTVVAGGREAFVYTAPVLRGGPASFTSFDLASSGTVTVTSTRSIVSARILPVSANIRPTVTTNTVSFALTRPANLTLELNDSFDRPLHLFANPVETDRPDPSDPSVVYYGPGVHEVETLRVHSGQTVYLAGGAIVRAKIGNNEKPVQERNWRGNKVYATLLETNGVRNVRVRGRGILDLGPLPWHARTAMWFGNSSDILVEGIIILDAPAWVVAMHGSKNVTVRNVKQICARENSDGIDICNSQDVLVEGCFLRNNDDEVCVKTTSPPPAPESRGIRVRRCVVWNDRARGLGITSETRADISDVVFEDCDVIHDFSNGGDCASLAILVSDSGTMSNIRFDNIRCEDVHNTLFNCWIGADMWGNDKERGHIRNVAFRDIQVTGTMVPVCKLAGFDAGHAVEDVTIERLRVRGVPVGDAATAKLQTNQHVRNVRFVGSR